MRFEVREYHGQSYSSRTLIVDVDRESVLLYEGGSPFALTPALARALGQALTAAATAADEVTRKRREAGQ